MTVVVALLAVYLPDVGHGFIRDDFAWILTSRTRSLADAWQLLWKDNGFYRPVVALTFSLSELVFPLNPFLYGLTNILFLSLCAAGIVLVGRALDLPRALSLTAMALWVLNPHGINKALLWISGRTALLLTALSLLTAWLVLKRYHAAAASACFLALLSKEEAVALPFLMAAWVAVRSPSPRAKAVLATWPLFIGLIPYFILRSQTHAMLPATAPPFYRPTFVPTHVLANALQYLDRTCSFPAAAALLGVLLTARRPRLQARDTQVVVLGVLWLCFGLSITVFLPVRSSLYACLPSVGACLAAAAVIGATLREVDPRALRRMLVAAAMIPLLLIPIYRRRNVRWVRPADVSRVVFSQFAQLPLSPTTTALVLHGTADPRFSMRNSFGSLLPEAVQLATHGKVSRVWLQVPSAALKGAAEDGPKPTESVQEFRLCGTRLVPAAECAAASTQSKAPPNAVD